MAARRHESGSGRLAGGKGMVVPSDLRHALEADGMAKAAFEALPPSHRRAYVEWIEEAKRPETRASRIAGTVERVREGDPDEGSDPTSDEGSDPTNDEGSDPTGLTP